jgi:hypothetical protein
MAVEVLTIAGAGQFTGLAGAGLFTFTRYNKIPRTTRVGPITLGYTEIVDDPITTNIRVFAVRPGGVPTAKVLLGSGLFANGLLDLVDGNAYLKLCGLILPREPGNNGQHWSIQVVSDGKANTGSFTLDHVMCPGPDTDPSDSAQ